MLNHIHLFFTAHSQVYTGDEPKSFSYYGDMCLIVLRLAGSIARAPVELAYNSDVAANTIIGNKYYHPLVLDEDGWPVRGDKHETVLRSSSQCVALIKFDKSLITAKGGKKTIQIMKNSLQQMLDKLFNGGVTKARNRFQPLINPFGSQQSWIGLIQRHYLNYNAPATLDSGVLPSSVLTLHPV